VGNSLQGVLEAWRRMGFIQRISLVSVLLACGAAAWLLVGWAQKPELALLYSRLDPQEAAEIVEKIRDADVPFELKDGGTSVYVPSGQVHTLRLQMAGEGLPAGGQQGYRIIDSEKIGASPFTQQVNFTRAMEGELARTIGLIDGVADARVHIVRAEGRLFQKDTGGASATVALRLRPGRTLSQGNVAAIVHMVAGAVDNLAPEHVVVVDSQGTLLSTGTEGGFAGTGGTVLDYKSQVEQYLSHKAEQMLTLVLGPGRAIGKVDAQVETTTTNKTEESYDPNTKVVTKEEITSKSEAPAAADASAGQSKEETTTSEYQVGRTVEQTINMPGKILSLSVAALVDLSTPETRAAEDGQAPAETASPPAPALTVTDAEEIIRRAVGLKETDELKVVSCRFHRPETAAEAAEEVDFLADPQFYLDAARHASVGILVLGALLALKMFGGSRRKAAAQGALAGAAMEGGQAVGADRLLGPGAGGSAGSAQLNERIASALQDNPDEVKRLFRTWVQQQGAA